MSDLQVVEKDVVEAPQEDQEASAALTAGYNKAMGLPAETPAKQEPEKAKTAQVDDGKKEADEAAAKAAAEEAEKERERVYLENLPASVRHKLEKLDKIDKIEATANQIGAAQRKLKTVEDRVEAISKAGTDAARAATAAGGAAPTKAQIDAAAAGGGVKWKQMMEDFPDWADAMEERLAALKPGSSPTVDVESITKEVLGTVQPLVAAARDEGRQLARIDAKHPGWEKTVNTPEFRDWTLEGGPTVEAYTEYKEADKTDPKKAREIEQGFATQFPKWWGDRGAALFSADADDAVKLLDGFEVHRKAAAAAAAKQEKNKARLAAAVAPTQANSGGPSVLPDEAGLAVGYKRIAERRA